MIRTYYIKEGVIKKDVAMEEVREALQKKEGLLWFDMEDPAPEEFDLLDDEFHFHDLSIEDCIMPLSRPKIDFYDEYFFLVLHGVVLEKGKNKFSTTELDVFVGKNYIVSVHEREWSIINNTAEKMTTRANLKIMSVEFLLYIILDTLVDSFYPIIDRIEDMIDQTDMDMFAGNSKNLLQRIAQLKKDILYIRKVVSPQREVFNVLVAANSPLIKTKMTIYFRNVLDHFYRIYDMIEICRDLITGTLEAYASVVSNKLNEIMKTLTIISTTILPLTFITGIYGMNFDRMPEIAWKYGYMMFWGIVCVVFLGMILFFKKKKWF